MSLLEFENYLNNRRILITGHTGFTGSWLVAWLQSIQCTLAGLSLSPNTNPSMFTKTGFESVFALHRIGDICRRETVDSVFKEFDPEIIFHLAAQPIVSVGYDDPHMTFEANVMGTLNILEAARNTKSAKAVVCVTTDKVYDNREWVWGYREIDHLGGKDPYSASKSACEMVIKTYQQSLAPIGNGVKIAAARGGNIIGGGDWAENRIVPDFVRAATGNGRLELRNPSATRPWQHVLALVHGYIQLGNKLFSGETGFDSSWNFGPASDGEKSVGTLTDQLLEIWPEVDVSCSQQLFKESHFLSLNSDKAIKELAWKPGLNFNETVEWTGRWYFDFHNGKKADVLTLNQVDDYRRRINELT